MRIYHPRWKRPDGEWQHGKVYWVQFSVGLASPFEEHMERLLADHVAEFVGFLKSRNVSSKHLDDRRFCLKAYMETTTANTIAAIDMVEAQRWLAEQAEGGLSARSVNRRFQALRQFGRWLVTTRRSGYNPFEGLTPRNEEVDRRRVRRALTEDELCRLLKVARERPLERAKIKRTRTGVTPAQRVKLARLGEARACIYETAASTGLRRGELRDLIWADMNEEKRSVTVRATVSKSKRKEDLVVRQDVVDGLVAHRARLVEGGFPVGPRDAVFPGRLFPTHQTFGADLKAAKLDGEDDQGRIVDFHSLRVTFITRLSQAGVHPRTAQALARHSKLELTMKTYTDVRLLDLRGALESATPQAATPRRLHAAAEA